MGDVSQIGADVPSQPVRVAIDLETTGLVVEQDCIVEIGAVKFAGDDILDQFESFVACRQPLPFRVQRLTGIRAADLENAPSLTDVSGRLRAFLGDHPLVGHSVPFDAAFLRRVGMARRNPLIDTYELASALLPNLPSYTLEAVGVALGLASPVYHRALADANLSRDVFLALLQRLEHLDPATLRALGRLSAGNDWTPAYFVRATMRAQGIHPASPSALAGTLGDQLTAKLGIDPAVLSLAIAREGGSSASAPFLPRRSRPHGATSSDTSPTTPANPDASISGEADATAATAGVSSRHGEATWWHDILGKITALTTTCVEQGGTALIDVDAASDTVLAALEPFVRHALAGQRVIVAAADTAGAARVARTYIPQVVARLGLPPDAVSPVEIGEQTSYLCLHRWFGAATQPRDSVLPLDLARGLAKIAVWTHTTRSGSRAEISLPGAEQVAWERTRSGPEFADSTPGCAYRERGYCFLARAEEAAHTSQLIVTTHAALAERLSGHVGPLPDAERVLVLDAHLLEDELRRAGAWSLEHTALAALLADLAQVERTGARAGLFHMLAQREKNAPAATWFGQVAKARGASDAFFAALGRLQSEAQRGGSKRAENQDQALRLDSRARRLAAWPEVESAWATLRPRLMGIAKVAGEAASRYIIGGGGRVAVASDGIATDLMGAQRRIETLCKQVDQAMSATSSGSVYWVRQPYVPQNRRNGQPSSTRQRDEDVPATGELSGMYAGHVEVGGLVGSLTGPRHGLVLVGSALAAGGDFEYACGTLGLYPSDTHTLSAAAARDDQTLLVLPEDAAEPNASSYQRQLDDMLAGLSARLGGRVVAIFPSHAALRAASVGIKQHLEKQDVLVLAQGIDGSQRQLWQTFRSQARVVLLGAGGFWDGIEMEGTAPACVVVTRLPFPSLSDPLLAARAELWQDHQNQFVVPYAALRLRQALNGLAWSHQQRNAVVLFDRRVVSREYGPSILATLPHCTVRHEPLEHLVDQVAAWVDTDGRG